MKYEKAIEILEMMATNLTGELAQADEKGAEYYRQRIEAIELAEKALERLIPRKPIYDGELMYGTWLCPNCETDCEVEYDKNFFCSNCGQAINCNEENIFQ